MNREIQAPPRGLSAEEQTKLVRRIAGSELFRKALRLREFLLFVASRTIDWPGEMLTEHEVGCHVFGRTADYHPAEDSIVRSAARQLRSKLKEYFDGAGRSEPWVLDIPKGGYVPYFLSREAAQPSACAPNLVSLLVENSPDRVQLVASDTALLLLSNMAGRTFSHEEYSGEHSLPFASLAGSYCDQRPEFWAALASTRLSSFADVALVATILGACNSDREKLVLRHSRDISTRDFYTGSAILIGGPLSNPWTTLFEERCQFRIKIHFDPEKFTSAPEFENHHPVGDEPARFRAKIGKTRLSRTFSRVVYLPNLSGNGKVLMLCGINAAASEGAGEFVADPATMPELSHLFESADPWTLPAFELVLETTTVDDVPCQSHICARRVLDQTLAPGGGSASSQG